MNVVMFCIMSCGPAQCSILENMKDGVTRLPSSHSSSLNQISLSSNYKKSLWNSTVLPNLPYILSITQPSWILSCCHNPLSCSAPFPQYFTIILFRIFLAHRQLERKKKPAAKCGLLRGILAGDIAFDFEKVKDPHKGWLYDPMYACALRLKC